MSSSRAKLLVVDDLPPNIEVLYEGLKDHYEVLFATNGSDALTLALREQPDLILLDVMMPGMDGFDVCQHLKADSLTRDIPVVFVSTMDDEAEEIHGLNLGAVDYFIKPIRADIAIARIRRHIEQRQLIDFLARQARRDALTGLANRALFEEVFAQEWQSALRYQSPLAVLMIDVDMLNGYNELYGYGKGDQCLKKIACLLSAAMQRPVDLVAHYGGENFICLLANMSLETALTRAEQLRQQITNLQLRHVGSSYGVVTVSIGVGVQIPAEHCDSRQLLEVAHQQLYAAKEDGGNKIKAKSIGALN